MPRNLGYMTLVLVFIILIVAHLRHDPFLHTLLFALILTVAAIPVALPAVLTVTMGVGALKLAKMKTIVSKLSSIEEMAGMDILCSDKTGTLTQNNLTIGDSILIGAKDEEELLLTAVLASGKNSEDVIDQVIFKALSSHVNLTVYETTRFIPFDSIKKRTEATIQHGKNSFKVTKGAPQVIMALVKDAEIKKQIEAEVRKLAEKGYRSLGVAKQQADGTWEYLGLISLFDPPRKDAKKTIALAQKMGIVIKMLTGDHGAIAKELARKIGLGDTILSAATLFKNKKTQPTIKQIEQIDGFSEVLPEHKFKIVQLLQESNHIVGMTGDGVNDAPVLKQADIGIAVGGATDAARAAAALVLTENGLSVIIDAIKEARKIIGVISDKVFGHAITFGMGGSLVEVIHDRAVALPPLNPLIIKHFMARTKASTLLEKFRNMPPANIEALTQALLRVSDMLSMLPCIQAMDINPLMVNDKDLVAVDARIIIEDRK